MESEEMQILELSGPTQCQPSEDHLTPWQRNDQQIDVVADDVTGVKSIASRAKTASAGSKKKVRASRNQAIELVESISAKSELSRTVVAESSSKARGTPKLWNSKPFLRPLPPRIATTPEDLEDISIDAAPVELTAEQELQAKVADLTAKAKAGDLAARQELNAILDQHQFIWQWAGDLARQAEWMLIDRASAGNPLLFESITRQASALRESLLLGNPSPLVHLSVQRVVACWLFVQWAEINLLTSDTLTTAAARLLEVAEKRYLTALKALNLVRRMSALDVRRPAVASN